MVKVDFIRVNRLENSPARAALCLEEQGARRVVAVFIFKRQVNLYQLADFRVRVAAKRFCFKRVKDAVPPKNFNGCAALLDIWPCDSRFSIQSFWRVDPL